MHCADYEWSQKENEKVRALCKSTLMSGCSGPFSKSKSDGEKKEEVQNEDGNAVSPLSKFTGANDARTRLAGMRSRERGERERRARETEDNWM